MTSDEFEKKMDTGQLSAVIVERLDNLIESTKAMHNDIRSVSDRTSDNEKAIEIQKITHKSLSNDVETLRNRLWWFLTVAIGGTATMCFKLIENWLEGR